MEIGNIITQDKMDLGSEFRIYESLDDVIHTDLPTLIIGCEITKNLFGDLNFMNRVIEPNKFWTFSKSEMRKYYYNDLEDFIQYCFEYTVKKLHYIYLDLLQFDVKKIKKILRKMFSLDNFHTFRLNNMIYLFSEKYIFGVDLELINFMGLNSDKILDKIKSRSIVFLVGDEVLIEYKNYMERLNFEVKYIPFIYSISNHE